MNAPRNLTTLSAGDLQQAIAHPDPDQWMALTPEELQQIQKRCKAHWSVWWMQLHPLKLFAIISGLLAIPVVVLAFPLDGLEMRRGFSAMALVGVSAALVTLLLMLLLTFLFGVFRLDRMNALNDRLKPIPHAEYYSKFSLESLAHSEGAQSYYEHVKAKGRELCVVDFEVMLKLAAADRLSTAS
ncbi:MAG: hypothetical protein CFE44_03815 [Burkholderiales bacterium PBB4]|nr:MAG: hypothetical protein CFE44_03815 [Burkholderiales bacterium PBB4]